MEEVNGRTKDEDNWRWYEFDGKKYISVTFVVDRYVKDYLRKWWVDNPKSKIEKRLEETSKIGSDLHEQAHENKEPRVMQLFEEKNIETLKSEFVVHSKHGYAGQCDRMVKMDGKTYLMDFKTGSFGTHAGAQLAGYALAVEESGTKVDGIGVVKLPRDGIGKAEFFDYSKNMDKCRYAFLCGLDLFRFHEYKKLEKWEFQEMRSVLDYYGGVWR
jgi:hypothetical protein